MSSTIIKGKYVLCKVNDEDAVEVVSDGAVFQENGEIIDVGEYNRIKADYIADEEIGSDQHVVLPGLINAHLHGQGVSYPLRGALDDNLEPWLISLMERKPVDPSLDNMYSIARLIESGVTTVMHSHYPNAYHYEHYEDEVTSVLKTYLEGGIRVAFALGMKNKNNLVYHNDEDFLASLPGSLAAKARKYLENIKVSEEEYFNLFETLNKKYGGGNSSKLKILHGPLGPQWCSDEVLIRMKQTADEYQTGIHTHMLETRYQKIYALKNYGKTIVEHLSDIGLLGSRVSFAHCVWVTESDIELLAKSGAVVCHNPSVNLRMKSGIAPVNQMLNRGVNIALGMDGKSINDDEDMLQELRLCANLHRTPGIGQASPTAGQVFKMATVNGARAVLLSDQIGTLEKGKRADIILINLKSITEPYLHPDINIVDALLSRGKASDVDTVMVDGEIIFHERKHTKINKNELIAKLRESLNRDLKPYDIERLKLAQGLKPHIINFYKDWDESKKKPFYHYNCA